PHCSTRASARIARTYCREPRWNDKSRVGSVCGVVGHGVGQPERSPSRASGSSRSAVTARILSAPTGDANTRSEAGEQGDQAQHAQGREEVPAEGRELGERASYLRPADRALPVGALQLGEGFLALVLVDGVPAGQIGEVVLDLV